MLEELSTKHLYLLTGKVLGIQPGTATPVVPVCFEVHWMGYGAYHYQTVGLAKSGIKQGLRSFDVAQQIEVDQDGGYWAETPLRARIRDAQWDVSWHAFFSSDCTFQNCI